MMLTLTLNLTPNLTATLTLTLRLRLRHNSFGHTGPLQAIRHMYNQYFEKALRDTVS